MPRPAQSGAEAAPGLPARLAALKMLDAVLRRDETLDHAARHASRGLDHSDAALALAIAGETLRRLPLLDATIDRAMRLPLADDAKARMVLRLALAQRIGLDTPPHAILATALPLVEGGPRRLVHGVLSNLFKRDLPTKAALPESVGNRWTAHWGPQVTEAATALLAQRPPLDLIFKQVVPHDFPGTSFLPNHRRLNGVDVTTLPGFEAGDWWVQDIAASLPARLVPASAKRVLDACAAPGGKTMQLAAAGHDVTALDRSKSRLGRLLDNLERTGLTAEIVQEPLEEHRADPYDAVLLDAPCSASGTYRRHPEVLYRARPKVIAEMAEVQGRLIDASADLVTGGGSLVYATCSLEPEEGEEQVRAFLKRRPDFVVEPVPTIGEFAPRDEGFWRVVPTTMRNVGGCDGFFAAHLVKRG